MSDFEQYQRYFPVGAKVSVAIPMADGNSFTDWAVVHKNDEDLVSLQLSRDTLPSGVRLSVGTILDVRTGNETSGNSCRAIIVVEGLRREILLRMIGEVVSSELREFYRIDAFLPIRYFICEEQNEKLIKEAWQTKREARIAAERAEKEHEKKTWQRILEGTALEELPQAELQTAEQQKGGEQEQSQEQDQDTQDNQNREWNNLIPLAANISGGGIRFLIHHQFETNTLVPFEIYLPSEPAPKVIDAVCSVAFSTENQAASKQFGRKTYNTGLKFKFIEERDRDAIVSYISNVQLKRIRMMREQYLFRKTAEELEQDESQNYDGKGRVKAVIAAAIGLLMLIMLISYFTNYSSNRPKNQIELIFEKGFTEYLKKIGRSPQGD